MRVFHFHKLSFSRSRSGIIHPQPPTAAKSLYSELRLLRLTHLPWCLSKTAEEGTCLQGWCQTLRVILQNHLVRRSVCTAGAFTAWLFSWLARRRHVLYDSWRVAQNLMQTEWLKIWGFVLIINQLSYFIQCCQDLISWSLLLFAIQRSVAGICFSKLNAHLSYPNLPLWKRSQKKR